MAFLDNITPTQYQPRRMMVRRVAQEGGGFELEVWFEMQVFTANGQNITHANWQTDLTQGQRDLFLQFVQGKLAEFEAETGLTLTQGNPE